MFMANYAEFSAESARGLVMPTLFLYTQSLGGDLATVGMLTSVFSLGRFLGSTFFGWMCDRYSFRTVYLLTSGIGLCGNILYLCADTSAFNSIGLLTLSRFLVGMGGGNRSVCRANVAALTHVHQRLTYLTILTMVVFLGYAVTPGLAGVLTSLDVTVAGVHIHALTCTYK